MSEPMIIGIQGERGSACDAAAELFAHQSLAGAKLFYFSNADLVLRALDQGELDSAVLAVESPVGVPIPETAEALALHPGVNFVAELLSEVRHCIMVRPAEAAEKITQIASHPVALEKHRHFLDSRFPGYSSIEAPDTGMAARVLAEGGFPPGTAVIALPQAAEVFGLTVVEAELPANDGYQTRFVVARKSDA